MPYHAPSKCPVCGHAMELTRLHCGHCGIELSGSFAPCRFCTLDEKHMAFVEAFLRCRGSIKEVEKVLGVSYPTVRSMMDAALNALGYTDAPKPETERERVLAQLAGGEIDVTVALDQLQNISKS